MRFRNEQIGDLKVVATGRTQTADVPNVEYLDAITRKQAQTEIAVAGDAITKHPVAIADEASVAPTAGDTVPAWHGHRFAGWIQRADEKASARPLENLSRRVLRQGAGQPPVARGDHGAPADRTVEARQFLNHRQET